MSIKEPTFEKMKEDITNTGGLFYQYRPCRRDVETIYDIENIRHGVVYAQTPLNMNDPFDSVAGFSAEKLYDNCITLLMDAVDFDDEFIKVITEELLRNRMLGQTAEFIVALNNVKNMLCLNVQLCIKLNFHTICLLKIISMLCILNAQKR